MAVTVKGRTTNVQAQKKKIFPWERGEKRETTHNMASRHSEHSVGTVSTGQAQCGHSEHRAGTV